MNISEIKRQIFPRHIGSEVEITIIGDCNIYPKIVLYNPDNSFKDNIGLVESIGFNGCLFLKSIESITEEDAKYIGYENISGFIYGVSDGMSSYESDILRSLGYATDQTVILDGKPVTLSVEELVKLGIFKIKK